MCNTYLTLVWLFLRASDTRDVPKEISINDRSDFEVVDASKIYQSFKYTTNSPSSEMSGPLYNFIVNICNVIIKDFKNSRIPTYINILSKALKGLGTEYLMKTMVKKFAKYLYKLSSFKGKLIKEKVNIFLNVIKENKPKRKELFQLLNSLYTIGQDIKMDVYVYRLKRYGDGRSRHIGKSTRNIFKKEIFYTISKQEDYVKVDIQLKFQLALIEYLREIE